MLSAKEKVKEGEKARKCWGVISRGLAKNVTFEYTLGGRPFQAEETASAKALSWELLVQGTAKRDPLSRLHQASWALCPALWAGGQTFWGCGAC